MQDGLMYENFNKLKNDFIENDPFLSSVISNAIVIIKNWTNNIHLGAKLKDTQDVDWNQFTNCCSPQDFGH